jgi:hypothetical protein
LLARFLERYTMAIEKASACRCSWCDWRHDRQRDNRERDDAIVPQANQDWGSAEAARAATIQLD